MANRAIRFASIFLSFFYLIFFSISLLSQEAEINKNEIIYGNNIGGWPPYNIVPKNDMIKPFGISQDIINEVTDLYGIELRNERYPEKRNQLYLLEGKIDLRSKAKEWVENPDLFYWSDPYIDVTEVIMYLKSKPLTIISIEDLFDKTIGTRLGYGYQLFKEYFEHDKIIRQDSTNDILLFRMLASERTDAAIVNKTVALWTIKENPEFNDLFEFTELEVGTAGYRFMFTKKYDWRPFIKFLDKELKQMKEDGRLNKILLKYK